MLRFAERLFGWTSIPLLFGNVISFDAEFACVGCSGAITLILYIGKEIFDSITNEA